MLTLIRPTDENKELADLQTAQKLAPDDWRTANELIDYYETNKDFPMALTTATAAYKKHKDKPDNCYPVCYSTDKQRAICKESESSRRNEYPAF